MITPLIHLISILVPLCFDSFCHYKTHHNSTLLVPCSKTGCGRWILSEYEKMYLTHSIVRPPTVPFYPISYSFNSDFSVLFRFPSQYLFAIGVIIIFRFNRTIPAYLHSNPKLCYSFLKLYSMGWFKPGYHRLYLSIPTQLNTPITMTK